MYRTTTSDRSQDSVAPVQPFADAALPQTDFVGTGGSASTPASAPQESPLAKFSSRDQRYLDRSHPLLQTPVVLIAGDPHAVAKAIDSLSDADRRQVLSTKITRDNYQFPLDPSSAPISIVGGGQPHNVLSKVMFSFLEYRTGGYHGLSLYDLLRGLQVNPNGVIINVEAPENILPVQEAIRAHFPLCPVSSILVSTNKQGNDDSIIEGSFSLQDALERLSQARRVYIQPESDSDEAREVSAAHLTNALQRARETALEAANQQSAALRTPRILRGENGLIPTEVMEVLDSRLIPEARGLGIHLVLKGGCAIAAFLDGSGRAVSPDVDYTVFIRHEDFNALIELTQAFTHNREVKIQAQPGAQFSHRSTKISGLYQQENGTEVELDAVPVRRVVREMPSQSGGFVFEFKYDAVSHQHRRTVILPSGQVLSVVPPELALVEKLTAARGMEQGKFDLFDSAGLLATFKLDTDLVGRYILRQRFKESLDTPLACEPLQLAGLGQRLQELGVEDPKLKGLVVERTLRAIQAGAAEPTEIRQFLTPTRIKQLMLADALLDGMNKVRSLIDADDSLPEKYRIKFRWGEGRLHEGLGQLETFIYAITVSDTLDSSNYVRRTPKSSRQSNFFDSIT